MVQGYGYVPDLGDIRDHTFKVAKPQAAAVTRPASVDLRAKMPPVWDQGQLGSCTAFALTAAVAYQHGFVGSQLWLYYRERALEHTTKSDSGAQIRDGIKVLNTQGLPPLTAYPYDISKFSKAPPAKVNTLAKKELVSSYQRLEDEDDYYNCLASGEPFVVGITVYESFESDAVAADGRVPMPGKKEKSLGGHAICVCGYEADGTYIVRNSWSDSWGDKGYFYLPKAYLANPNLATDAWSITACTE